jgi:hypothetical protein
VNRQGAFDELGEEDRTKNDGKNQPKILGRMSRMVIQLVYKASTEIRGETSLIQFLMCQEQFH